MSAVLALYLNVFVGLSRRSRSSVLASLAPTQSEPPFLIAQAVVLVIFIVLGVVAVRSFRPPADVLVSSAI